jgi:hypothetical protein
MFLVFGYVLFVIRSTRVELVTFAAAEFTVSAATGHELCQQELKFYNWMQANYLYFWC